MREIQLYNECGFWHKRLEENRIMDDEMEE